MTNKDNQTPLSDKVYEQGNKIYKWYFFDREDVAEAIDKLKEEIKTNWDFSNTDKAMLNNRINEIFGSFGEEKK